MHQQIFWFFSSAFRFVTFSSYDSSVPPYPLLPSASDEMPIATRGDTVRTTCVKEMTADAAKVALCSSDAKYLPPEMLEPAKARLQALGSQVANKALAGAAETARRQIDGRNANRAPALQQYEGLVREVLLGVKAMVASVADDVLLAAAVATLPPETGGPAKVALRALGEQVARLVSSAIADAAQTEHEHLFNEDADRAPTLSEIDHATDDVAERAKNEMAAAAAAAVEPHNDRRSALVKLIVAVVFIVGALVLVGVINRSPSNTMADAAESEIDHAIDDAAKQVLSGVTEIAADAAEAALAEAVPPELRGHAKAAAQALGSRVASRVSSAIADAAETAHKQADGANVDSGRKR
jgi:hypothetical protein